jgi:signal transduction histidine kinase
MTQGENSSFFLEKSREQLYLLNSLIENILDINKFEKKQTPLNKESFDVREVIEPHIVRHQTTKGKEISIKTEISEGAETLFGDKLHITNAVGNLIDNAVKYSGEKTEIIVSAVCDTQYCHIAVKDNGIGIPKEEQSKVFEKFYRIGKKEHSQKGKGFGLGLTYVMWVLKAHKGRVSLSSEPSKGSTFTLSFKKEL